MAKILIVGNPDSPLVRARGVIGMQGGHAVYWFAKTAVDLPAVTPLAMPSFARNFFGKLFLEPFFLRLAINRVRPDIIHVHYAFRGLATFALLGEKNLVVTTMGSDIMPQATYKGVAAWFTRRLLRSAEIITVKSAYMEEAVKAIDPRLVEKIRLINWGTDLETFHLASKEERLRLREKWGLVSKDFFIFEPRNAKPLYNKHIVIEAFSMLRKTHPNSILLLASGNSDPAYLGQLKSQVQRLRLQDSVRFLEKLSPIEMAELYNIADLTVSVPRTDGFPQSIYEALACGSRLLLSDLPQYNDFVSAFQAVPVVEIGDASATAQAFKSTLQVGVDEEYRAKAHAYAEANANADSESAKLLAIYAELASRPR